MLVHFRKHGPKIVELVERFAENMNAGKQDRVLCRLESDDAAIGRRANHRTVGLRAERTDDLPRRVFRRGK